MAAMSYGSPGRAPFRECQKAGGLRRTEPSGLISPGASGQLLKIRTALSCFCACDVLNGIAQTCITETLKRNAFEGSVPKKR